MYNFKEFLFESEMKNSFPFLDVSDPAEEYSKNFSDIIKNYLNTTSVYVITIMNVDKLTQTMIKTLDSIFKKKDETSTDSEDLQFFRRHTCIEYSNNKNVNMCKYYRYEIDENTIKTDDDYTYMIPEEDFNKILHQYRGTIKGHDYNI